MRRELPDSSEILEELADKAAIQIDRLAPVAFDAALDELIRYHRFLLSVNATRTLEGKPFSYAALAGEAWSDPLIEWIRQYRRLFARGANHIGDDTYFIRKLAYVPQRLLPSRNDPQMSDQVLQGIVDLGPILVHQLEAWVTKRTVIETPLGETASLRTSLAGSDAKAHAGLLPDIVGAWESLLQAAPSVYSWHDDSQGGANERWNSLRASWPFLWQHLRNTAYMLAVCVWNEDASGAVLFRDALVRWPQTLRHHFHGHAYFIQKRLLFPDIVSADLAAAMDRIKPLLPEHMPPPTPDELFNSMLLGAHDDVLLLTAALLLLWSMEEKQTSDIGARTASALMRKELADSEDHRGGQTQDRAFESLFMDFIRLELASGSRSTDTYGVRLDNLVERLDNMTERRVVPGRVFTPSTLHGRDGLLAPLLAMLLVSAPESPDALITHCQKLAVNEHALPAGDRSIRDVVSEIDRLLNLLEGGSPIVQRGVKLLKADADFSELGARLKAILSSGRKAIETERENRLRAKTINKSAIRKLRDAAEIAMAKSPGEVPFFRGFSINRATECNGAETYTVLFNGLRKAQFVDPPMESEALGFEENFAKGVAQAAGKRAWGLFTRRPRELITVPSNIEELAFWERVKLLARDVGAEPLLIVSRLAEGRVLRKLIYRRESPTVLKVERKAHDQVGDFYIGTIEGIDVYGADFEPGKAWLFSPYLLQSLHYAEMKEQAWLFSPNLLQSLPYVEPNEDHHIIRVSFRMGEDLNGSLVAEFKLDADWADWPIYEIDFEDLDVAGK
jgi:hypothetical protein